MESYEDERILEERKRKQEYLKTEILGKGYDGAQFAEYLNSLREDGNIFLSTYYSKLKFLGGSNIDIWSYSDIKAVRFSLKQ